MEMDGHMGRCILLGSEPREFDPKKEMNFEDAFQVKNIKFRRASMSEKKGKQVVEEVNPI